MIHVLVDKKDGWIRLLHIEGHAESGRLVGGRYDLVCAGVSAVAGYLKRGLMLLGKSDLFVENDVDAYIRVIPDDDERVRLLVNAAAMTLEDMALQHKKQLEIHKTEG